MSHSDELMVLGKDVLQLRLFTELLPRFSNAFLGLSFAHDALEQNKEKIAQFLSRGTPELIEKVSDPENISEEQLQEIQGAIDIATDQSVEDYLSTLRNLHVVLLCTSLEIALNEVVDIVLQTEPNILIGAASEKSVTLKEIIKAGDYESILSRIREKQIKLFSWGEIEEKMSFLEKHMGIGTEDIFEWDGFTEGIQILLKDCDLGELKGVFRKRHSIVHHGERPFEDQKEVERILEFFQKLTFNLCTSISKKFKIPIDMLGFHPRWMRE